MTHRYVRLARLLGAVALALLVVATAVFAVPALVGAEYSYSVRSGSMSPAIDAGDAVVVADRPTDAIQVGDVVTFVPTGFSSTSDVRVTHRVVAVHDRSDGVYFETKGDANEDPDPRLVPAERVVGVVVLTIPQFGRLAVFAGTPAGKIGLVAVPAAVLAVTEFRSLVRARQERGE
jgi:signal peptidase